MSTANSNVDGSSPRVCPVALKFRAYAQTFMAAARSAVEMESVLSVALGGGGTSSGFTPANLQTVEMEELERIEDDLDDLKDQVEYVMEVLQNVIELRNDPETDWAE